MYFNWQSFFFFQFLVSHDLKYDDSKYLPFPILNNCLFPIRKRTSFNKFLTLNFYQDLPTVAVTHQTRELQRVFTRFT